MEAVLRCAFERGRCFVSFSGGLDSSVLLAVATRLARRESLPLPIPVTNRFRTPGTAEESTWQELVVAHLGLDDWIRLTHDDELDCVGPIARETVAAHGLLWPFNAYFHVPLLRAAGGGTLATGLGGDEILAGSRWTRVTDALRDPRNIGTAELAAAAPRALRAVLVRRQLRDAFGWLRPGPAGVVRKELARQASSEPLRWREHVEWRARLRYLRIAAESLRVLGGSAGVDVVHPFIDRGYVAAMARRSSRPADRSVSIRELFGDVLPPRLLARTSKARFDGVFWGEHARAFASAWDGTGVDSELVDADALAEEWWSDEPRPLSFLLAQAVCLHGSADHFEDTRGRIRQG